MTTHHLWQVLAAAMSRVDGECLLTELKKYRIEKIDLLRCHVCMVASPRAMRLQRLRCSCQACANVEMALGCSWCGRIMTCQVQELITVEEAYQHATPARRLQKPALNPPMKAAVQEWAAQGLKPKRNWNPILNRCNLNETTVPPLTAVQRIAHHHVTGRFGGSDLLDAVRRKVREVGFTGQEEETAAFTFTAKRTK